MNSSSRELFGFNSKFPRINCFCKLSFVSFATRVKYRVSDEFKKNQKKKETFNYKKFKQSKEGRFQRVEIIYKIRISNFSLEHLLLNYDFKVKILKDEKNWKIIEIIYSDEIELFKALFGYDIYALILEPKQAVINFKNKLNWILENLNQTNNKV